MMLVSLKRPSKCWMGRIYDKIKTVDIEEIVYIEVSPSVFYQLRYELDPPIPLPKEDYYFTLYGIPIKECKTARHNRYMGLFLKIKDKPKSSKLIVYHL